MNSIPTVDTAKDVAAQTLEAVRTMQAIRREDVKAQPVTPADTQSQDKGKDDSGNALAKKDPQEILKQAKEYFGGKGVNLDFKRVDDSGDIQVEMVDATTHKVIRKIPEDEVVKLADNIKKMAKGVMDKAI